MEAHSFHFYDLELSQADARLPHLQRHPAPSGSSLEAYVLTSAENVL